jgi:superfamily II DNA or RNA helicase
MSMRQLRTRIERLEAKAPEPANSEGCAARARWEELRLRGWKQKFRPTEVEKPLTEEEEAELTELSYRFDKLGPVMRAWAESTRERRLKSRSAVQTR